MLKKHGIPMVNKYNHKGCSKWISNQTDVSEVELFQLATNQFDELVKRFYIRFFDADVSNFLKLFVQFLSVSNEIQ